MARLLRHTNLIIPITIIICLAYYNYATAYVVAYREIYKHHSKAGAVLIWVFTAILQISMLVSFGYILIRGPGKTAKLALFDIYDTKEPGLSPVPDMFLCDEHGYPYWCSVCNSIKPKRSYHIKDLNRCVPRFDHKCLWLGTSVGRGNHVFFIHFIMSFDCLFLISLISAAATARTAMNRSSKNTPHYIVIFACAGLWIPMISALVLQQIAFAFTNRTTIDDISMKQARKYNEWKKGDESDVPQCLRKNMQRNETGIRYVNVKTKTSRVVVPFSVRDHPYSDGFRKNITRLVYGVPDNSRFWSAVLYLCIPLAPALLKERVHDIDTYDNSSEDFSEAFLSLLGKKIEDNEFTTPVYLRDDGEEDDSSQA